MEEGENIMKYLYLPIYLISFIGTIYGTEILREDDSRLKALHQEVQEQKEVLKKLEESHNTVPNFVKTYYAEYLKENEKLEESSKKENKNIQEKIYEIDQKYNVFADGFYQ